jgi:hypothetical protein
MPCGIQAGPKGPVDDCSGVKETGITQLPRVKNSQFAILCRFRPIFTPDKALALIITFREGLKGVFIFIAQTVSWRYFYGLCCRPTIGHLPVNGMLRGFSIK